LPTTPQVSVITNQTAPPTGKINATLTLTSSPIAGGVILTSTLSVPKNGTVSYYWAVNNTQFLYHAEGPMVNGVFSRSFQFASTGTYYFKINWIGDAEVNAVESNVISVNTG